MAGALTPPGLSLLQELYKYQYALKIYFFLCRKCIFHPSNEEYFPPFHSNLKGEGF